MENFWDKRYDVEEYVYGEEPNHFFMEQLKLLQPGKLLLPAEGEGRNAVYAAKQGHEVFAFDNSVIAKKKAMNLAGKHGVKINYLTASYEEVELEHEYFDAVALIYAHTSNRKSMHRKMLNFLKPGGMMILEGFSKDQLKYNTGGPGSLALLFSPEEIRKDFIHLTNKSLQKEIIHINESRYHGGKASVVRFTGIKK